tara:strand:+ start:595 stop:1149 length:555 start_codon:yes stop_codon:yes gene_type:complete
MTGIVPPIRPNVEGHDPDRSPYIINLNELIEALVFSQERADIVFGLLEYRKALHESGISTGFQWLDGSFLENVEDIESRPPNDIDVVTFFELPVGQDQNTYWGNHGALFDPVHTKKNYSVDAYPFVLRQVVTEQVIRMTSYWYSMWSHRRDGIWKGFVQVVLDPDADITTHALLSQKAANGFEQ